MAKGLLKEEDAAQKRETLRSKRKASRKQTKGVKGRQQVESGARKNRGWILGNKTKLTDSELGTLRK